MPTRDSSNATAKCTHSSEQRNGSPRSYTTSPGSSLPSHRPCYLDSNSSIASTSAHDGHGVHGEMSHTRSKCNPTIPVNRTIHNDNDKNTQVMIDYHNGHTMCACGGNNKPQHKRCEHVAFVLREGMKLPEDDPLLREDRPLSTLLVYMDLAQSKTTTASN